MANTARPFGLRPVQSRSGAPWSGKTQAVIIKAADTASYGAGTVVKYTGDQAVGTDGRYYPVVTVAAAADTKLAGAVVGVHTIDLVETQYLTYRPAAAQSGDMMAFIPADRDVIYEAQEDSVGGAIASTAAGQNIDFVVGAVDTATGMATTVLDSSTAATTAALPLRLISYGGAIDNEAGAYATWLVTINQDAYINTTGV